jgi:hypothetical protein
LRFSYHLIHYPVLSSGVEPCAIALLDQPLPILDNPHGGSAENRQQRDDHEKRPQAELEAGQSHMSSNRKMMMNPTIHQRAGEASTNGRPSR